MIKTRSIYATKKRDDGHRVLITRYYPRGIKKTHFDEWIRDLSPSQDLLKDYKGGKMNWECFEQEFLAQIKSNAASMEIIRVFASTAASRNITLLCYEKEGEPCHRHLIASLIRKKMGTTKAIPKVDVMDTEAR